jgi:hypothetical protein
MTSEKKAALKEAITDTAIATLINFPLNILLLWIANRTFIPIMITEAQQIFWTSVYLTIAFSAVAITRKTYVRLYFNRKHLKKEAKRT